MAAVYDLHELSSQEADLTIGQFMSRQLKHHPVVGDRVPAGRFELVVRRVHRGETIADIGLSLATRSGRKGGA